MMTRIPRSRIALCLLAMLLGLPRGVFSQSTLEEDVRDDKGFHADRSYFSPEPWEHFDPLSGNLILTFADLALPGNAGRTLTIQRIYNNQRYDLSPPPLPTGTARIASRGTGARWTFGFPGIVMQVVEQEVPVGHSFAHDEFYYDRMIQTTPLFVMADGSVRRTLYIGEPTAATAATMAVVSPEFYQYDRASRVLRMPDGTVCYYEAATGRLISFHDPFGNLVELLWNAAALTIRQHLGNDQTREVVLSLDQWSRVTSMQFLGREWHYEYGHGEGEGADITAVTLPEGLVWTFEYENGPFSNLGIYETDGLVRTTTPNGGVVTYEYAEHVIFGQSDLSITQTVRNLRFRRSSGPSVEEGEWQLIHGPPYAFWAYSNYTTIIMPSQRRVVYFHDTNYGILMSGWIGLRQFSLYAQNGELVEREYRVNTSVAVGTSGGFETPEIQDRTITRREAGQDRVYSTHYNYSTSNLGDYHHPSSIVETSPGHSRTTTLTYEHLSGPYVVGLPKTHTTAIDTQSFTRTRSYEPATGFLTEERIFGLATTFTRDALGNIQSTATPLGHTTTYAHSWGQVSEIHTPADSANPIVRVINPDGTTASQTRGTRTTTFGYDDLMRTTSVQPPGGTHSTITVYNDSTTASTVSTNRGTSAMTSTLDGFGRTIGTVSTVGVRTTTRYDAEGRRTYEGYPFTNADIGTNITYDALDRVVRRTNPDQSFNERIYGSDTVAIRDEKGRQTLQVWQAFGNPDDARLVAVADAAEHTWTYAYNAVGSLSSVTAPDGTTRQWTYNSSNQLTAETHPESGLTTYAYNGHRLVQKVDANATEFSYTYDDNDRLRTIGAGTHVTSIDYEPGSDKRASISVDDVVTTFAYDGAGRPSRRTDIVDGYQFTSTYGYDLDDNLTSLSYPSSGVGGDRRLIGYDYDSEHRILRVFDQLVTRDFAGSFLYNPSGSVTSYIAGNNVQSVFNYDPARYWMTSLNVGGLWSLQYQNYDLVGNVGTIADSRPAMNQTLGYDVLDRLTSVASSGYPSATYQYDAHGNRTNANGVQYTYVNMRLQSQNVESYTYDANGNLRTSPNRTYTYTPNNMLSTATVSGASSSYAYDGDDWRVKKTTANTTTYYLRAVDGQLLTEWKNPGPSGETKDYIYAGTKLVTSIGRPTSEVLDLHDHLTVGAPPMSVTVTIPGQRALLTFDAIAGHEYSVVGLTMSGYCMFWPLSVLKPDGNLWQTQGSCGTAYLDRQTAPSSGTYTVVVDPYSTSVGTVAVAVYDVVDINGGSISLNGSGILTTFTIPGQKAIYTFNAVEARRYSMWSSVLTTTGDCLIWPMTVFKPDGTVWKTASSCGDALMEQDAAPATGTYTIFVDPNGPGTGTIKVNAWDVVDFQGTITPDGTPVDVSLPSPSQKGILTFTGVEGHRYGLFGQMLWGSVGCMFWPMTISQPNSSVWKTTNSCGDAFIDPEAAPASGTYTIVIDPNMTSNGPVRMRLSDVVDVSGSLTVNASPVLVSLPQIGQVARFTVNLAAGDVTVRLTNNTIGWLTRVRLLKPDGTEQTSVTTWVSDFNLPTQTLTSGGTYTVEIDPLYERTGSISVQVTSP